MSLVLAEPAGTITVTAAALAALVVQSAETLEGVHVRRGRRRLEIEIDPAVGRVRLELTARYGLVLPEVARDVQERVASALARMCAVRIDSVDVSVEEIE
jgi:uncharacterized alkaline shock family protein YloU